MAARPLHWLPAFVLAWTLAFLITPALSLAACSGATTNTYIGPAAGDWATAANWVALDGVTHAAPVASDVACVPAGTSVLVSTGATVGDVDVEGGLRVSGVQLTVGPLIGSRLAGTVEVDTGGVLDLRTATHYNGGTLALNNGELRNVAGNTLYVDDGFNIDSAGGGFISNSGILHFSGSTGLDPAVVAAALNNDGLVTNDGPVDVNGGGHGGGDWKLGSGTGADEPVVTIDALPFTMNGDFTDVESGGAGHLVVANTSLSMQNTLAKDPHIVVNRLDLLQLTSTIDFSPIPAGTSSVSVNELNVKNGVGAGLLEVNAPLTAQAVTFRDGAMLVNGAWTFGTFHWGGGDISSGGTSTLTVNGLDMSTEAGDQGDRSTTGNVIVEMAGAQFASPTYTDPLAIGASFDLGGGTVFKVGHGAHFAFGDDLDIGGTGSVVNDGIIDKQVGGGTGSRISPPLTTTNGELWVTDAGSSLNLDVAPDTFAAGVLTGTYILDGILSFPGTVTSFAGHWQLGASGQITDGIAGPDALSTLVANGPGSTISVFNPLALTQSFTNNGVIDIKAGGSLTMAAGKTYTQVAGATTKLSDPGSQLNSAGALDISGGTLQGVGTVNADVVNGGGTVAPGNSPGTLSINGNFTQNGTGVFFEEIDGPGAGQFDKLQVTGTATLGGVLIIGSTNGYQAPDAQSFDIVAAGGGVVGTWGGIVQAGFAPYFDQIYTANSMVLSANSVSAGDVTVLEGNSGSTDATFTISLGAAAPAAASVDWATQDGSATAGSDYAAASGTVTFAPGETRKTVTVAVNGDTAPEGDENLAINLANAIGTRIRDGQGVGTITEDDAPQAQVAQVLPGDIDGFPVPPPPVQGRAVNVEPVSGTVLVKLPGKTRFVPLPDAEQVPVGTIVDARNGRVRLFSVGKAGRVQSAEFYEGVFQVTQKAGQALTNLKLFGASFSGCPKLSRASAAAKRKKTSSVRHLWGSGSGEFRTTGRYASATIRGTRWLTDDRCNGTLIRVTVGAVTVRDQTLKKSIVLKKPKSYLAPAVKPRRR